MSTPEYSHHGPEYSSREVDGVSELYIMRELSRTVGYQFESLEDGERYDLGILPVRSTTNFVPDSSSILDWATAEQKGRHEVGKVYALGGFLSVEEKKIQVHVPSIRMDRDYTHLSAGEVTDSATIDTIASHAAKLTGLLVHMTDQMDSDRRIVDIYPGAIATATNPSHEQMHNFPPGATFGVQGILRDGRQFALDAPGIGTFVASVEPDRLKWIQPVKVGMEVRATLRKGKNGMYLPNRCPVLPI